MKQPKVTTTPPPAPAPAILRGPRYRYFSTTPTKVTLRMRDLQLPEKARTATYDSEQFVDLPCADIFQSGPVPKIRLTRLAELAPECVTAADLPDEGVKLCAARLALAYAVTEGRELIEEPPTPELPPSPPPVLEDFAPPISAKKDPEEKSTSLPVTEKPKDEKVAPAKPVEPAAEPLPTPPGSEFRPRRRWLEAYRQRIKSEAPAAKEIPTPVETPAPKPVETSSKPEADAKPPAETKSTPDLPVPPPPADKPAADPQPKIEVSTPAPKPAVELPTLSQKPAPDALSEPPLPADKSPLEPAKPVDSKPPESGTKAEATAPTPLPTEAKRPFSLFPKFRRKEAEEAKPSVVVPRNRIEIPAPKRPIVPLNAPPLSPLSGDTASPVVPAPSEPGALAPIPPPSAKPPFEPTKSFAPKPPAPKPGISVSEPVTVVETAATKPPVEAEKIREPEPAAKPPTPEPLAPVAAKLPPPPPALTPPATEPPLPQSAEVPPPPPVAAPPVATPPVVAPVVAKTVVAPPAAVLVETEHLTKEQDRPEIAEQDALQAIFLTEEFLSVDRVLELCGNLPGIRSCVLSSGANVIASHNAPDSVDIVSLSAHALDMIKSMRSSAAKMGIGAVPAVTVHSEKGPITFFHQDDLCLLVLHKDRGFVPGVREKLEQVVHELSAAKLPLRLGQGTVKKLPGS